MGASGDNIFSLPRICQPAMRQGSRPNANSTDILRPSRGPRSRGHELPTPHETILRVQDLAGPFEATGREDVGRGDVLRLRVGQNSASAGTKRELDERRCRFLRISATLIARINTVRDLDRPL